MKSTVLIFAFVIAIAAYHHTTMSLQNTLSSAANIKDIIQLINDYKERESKIPSEIAELFLSYNIRRDNDEAILHNYINHQTRSFGGWAIDQEVLETIKTLIEPGSIILELGSGDGTFELLKFYKVFSIEHDPKWVNKYHSTYIHAPIKNGWYDAEIVKSQMPDHYDLILVDGPPGNIGRGGFLTNLHLFNTSVPIIFDDVNRKPEYDLMQAVAQKVNKTFMVISTAKKQFGIVK